MFKEFAIMFKEFAIEFNLVGSTVELGGEIVGFSDQGWEFDVNVGKDSIDRIADLSKVAIFNIPASSALKHYYVLQASDLASFRLIPFSRRGGI